MLATWTLLSVLTLPTVCDEASARTSDGNDSNVVWIQAERVIVRPGVELENAAVLIEDGIIVAVGADVEAPDNARILKGGVVCAGFVDPWSSLQVDAGSVDNQNLEPGSRTVDALDPFSRPDQRSEALAGGVTAVRAQAGSSSFIGGIGAVVQNDPGTDSVILIEDACLATSIGVTRHGRVNDVFDRVAEVERLVGQVEKGAAYRDALAKYEQELADWQKAIDEKTKELEDDFKKAKKKRDKDVADAEEKGKEHKDKKYKEDKKPKKPRYDPTIELLGRVADGELPLVVEAHRVPEIRNLLERTEDLSRLRLVLAGATQSEHMAEALVERHVPVMIWPAPEASGRDEYDGFDLGLAGRLADEGVEVLLGSGGGPHARDLRYLAALAVSHGLDRDAALHAITLGPARAFDVADRVGSVERGRDGDVLVFDGDPLDTTSTLQFVLSRGRVVE